MMKKDIGRLRIMEKLCSEKGLNTVLLVLELDIVMTSEKEIVEV